MQVTLYIPHSSFIYSSGLRTVILLVILKICSPSFHFATVLQPQQSHYISLINFTPLQNSNASLTSKQERSRGSGMTNVSTFEGLLSCVLIFICSCAHLRRVKALKPLINNAVKQFGPLSIFHKASVIGLRLQVPIGILCITVAIYVIVR